MALDYTLDRPLPHSPDSERAVLGSILINNNALHRVAPILKRGPDEFFKDANRTIYATMLEMDVDGMPIEPMTLKAWLERTGRLVDAGGIAYISSLYDTVPDVANVERYAEFVHDFADRREVITASSAAMRAALDTEESTGDIAAELQLKLSKVGEIPVERTTRPFIEIVSDSINRSMERASKGELIGIRTGFKLINEKLLGLPRQGLTVISAPSSQGKTALGLQIVEGAVVADDRVKAAIYEAEMPDDDMANRLIARNCRIDLHDVRRWKIDSFQREAIDRYLARLRRLQQRISLTTRLLKLRDVVADIKRRKAEHGLDLVMVDYLQLIEAEDSEEKRERQVNLISWTLGVELARTLDIAVIGISQVTRDKGSGRITGDSTRDSKAINHHATLHLIVEQPRHTNKADTAIPWCTAVLQVEKQRNGQTGDFPLHWDGRYQSFSEGECPSGCPFGSGGMRFERGDADQPGGLFGRN